MKSTHENEWSRYYRLHEFGSMEALHARFVSHRYARHVHEYFVIGLVENGTQSYWYRGAQHITSTGQILLVNPDEPHTGEAAAPGGNVYRTQYPHADYLARVAEDGGNRVSLPFFRGAVLRDPLLARLLSRFHKSLAKAAPRVETESFLLDALARLITRDCGFLARSCVWQQSVGRQSWGEFGSRAASERALGGGWFNNAESCAAYCQSSQLL
jgi:hypothetical protein